ncbi:hypothetical protein B0T10DRAFT_566826 [Thelonectria olida]|uniref:Uncharacterized protein n=1 Tax=Thelonectria olida TaxID=1576542 RepID=A0A9P8VWJ3_9HYPO|nr:hypothetical protein B0T10DRAFT_566826 [Thelonectria olida]
MDSKDIEDHDVSGDGEDCNDGKESEESEDSEYGSYSSYYRADRRECWRHWRSYCRSDPGYYEELRDGREERKFELLRAKYCGLERLYQSQYDTTYEALRKAEKKRNRIPISPRFKYFTLYFEDFFKHLAPYPTEEEKCLIFDRWWHDLDPNSPPPAEPKDKDVPCEVYLGAVRNGSEIIASFMLSEVPTNASSTPLRVRIIEGYRLETTFVSSRFLKVKVSREFAHLNSDKRNETVSKTIPVEFGFIGVMHNE